MGSRFIAPPCFVVLRPSSSLPYGASSGEPEAGGRVEEVAEEVVIAFAPEGDVIAAPGVEPVVAQPPDQDVVTVVGDKDVGLCPAVQVVRAGAAAEEVPAGAAEERIALAVGDANAAAAELGVINPGVEIKDAVRVLNVCEQGGDRGHGPGATGDQCAAAQEVVVAFPAQEQVVSRAIYENVVAAPALQVIVARAAAERVVGVGAVVGAAHEVIGAAAAEQHIAPGAAVEVGCEARPGVPGAGFEPVVVFIAVEPVAAVVAINNVVAREAVDDFGVGGAVDGGALDVAVAVEVTRCGGAVGAGGAVAQDVGDGIVGGVRRGEVGGGFEGRSEEHTSELQSQFHLVCRL